MPPTAAIPRTRFVGTEQAAVLIVIMAPCALGRSMTRDDVGITGSGVGQMQRKWLLVVLLASAAAVLGATLYKWVDERGVTHYSETPPVKQKAQEIRIQSPPPSKLEGDKSPRAPPAPGAEVGKTAPPKTWHEKALEAQKRREAAEKQEEEEQQLAREVALEKKRKCLAAQQNLHTLLTDRPVYWINEYGERVFIDDTKRATEIARAKREIQSYCDPKPK